MSTTSNTETATTNSTATSTTTSKLNPEQAVAFAALILADDNLAITPEKLQTLLKAAGITEVEPIWTTLFANALKDKDVKNILTAAATSSLKAGGDAVPACHHCDEEGEEISDVDSVCIGSDSGDEMGTMGLFD
ncbi:60s Acidic ribosomal protein [Stagonosporopsis vannaccii]|nr:60s Acidic ribosomal protein [Stagonosporopsis vannaccii]